MAVIFFRALRRVRIPGFFLFAVAAIVFVAPSAPGASQRYPTIVIDAGHGGFDRGGVPGQRVAEKAMALDVAQRLAVILRRAGYRVVMTRNSDVFVTLGQRVRIANSYGDAAFVCIHFNSASRVGANGVETYYYSTRSAGLAADIHRQLIAGTTGDNRGIRRRGYYVLRRTSVPAVLVECGFLTNPTEARLALQASYRERLAQRIAYGIMGRPPETYRPVVAGLTHVPAPIRQRFDYRDWVQPAPERSVSSRHRSRRSKSKKSSSSSKKKSSTTSSKKKKKATSEEDN